MKFTIEYLKVLHTKVPYSNFTLITGTPMVIRIDRERYEKYGYESIFDNFTYWRNEQPVDVFIEQLQIKLLSKYARYHTKSYNEYHEFLAKYNGNKIFDIFRFTKTIHKRIGADYNRQLMGIHIQ